MKPQSEYSIHPKEKMPLGNAYETISGTVNLEDYVNDNKARSVGPGRLPAQPWCLPEGVGRSCAVG